jgi:hypothetical protein
MLLDEDKIENPNGKDTGRRLMAVFNQSAAPIDMPLPSVKTGGTWQRVLDTDAPDAAPAAHQDNERVRIAPRSAAVFVRKP